MDLLNGLGEEVAAVVGRHLGHDLRRDPHPVPYPFDKRAYRRRNLIERLFGRLKNWRRIATRYDRLARSDLAALALVAVAAEWAK